MGVNVNGGPLIFDAGINMGDFERDLARLRSGINGFNKDTENQANQVEGFAKRAAQAAAGFLSIQAATGFIKSMVQVRGEFQQIEVAFTTMLKSKDAADKLMSQAVKLAAITPFTLTEVASGAKQLLAYGFAAKDVTKNLEMLGNIASGVGSDLNAVVYLYGTLKASGRVTQMDINQFAGRGIPIYEALATVLKKNTNEIRGLVSAGKVGFPQVEQAFQSLTGPAGQFFNLMQEQSKTLTGQLSNLEDAWDRMLNDLGKQNEGLFADAIGGAIDLIGNYQKIIDIIEGMILVYGSYRAALVLTTVASNASAIALNAEAAAFYVLRNGILGTIASLDTLKAGAILAGAQLAAITAVLAALGAVIYSLIQEQSALEIAQKAVTQAQKDGERAAESERGKIDGLIDTIQSHKSSKAEQKAAYDDLQQEMGNYLKSYSLEEVAAGKASGAIALFTGHIANMTATEREYAAYKGLEDKLDDLNKKGIEAVTMWDRLAQSLKNTFIPTSQGLTTGQWWDNLISGDASDDTIVKQMKDRAKKAQEIILKTNSDVKKKLEDAARIKKGEDATGLKGKKYEDFNDVFAKGNVIADFDQLIKLAPNKAALDKLKESVNGSLEALAPGDKNIEAYKKKVTQVDNIIAQYSASKDNSKATQASKDRLEFLKELTKTEQAAIGKTLTQNEEALKSIHDKYERQRDRANELGLGKGVIQRIDNAEKKETGNAKYEQDTKLLIDSLGKEKQLYVDYEEFKDKFGLDAAKKRYQGQIDIGKTFTDRLLDEQKKLTDIPVDQRTGSQNERLKQIDDQLKEERRRAQLNEDNKMQDALQASESFNLRRVKVEDEYLKRKAEIDKVENEAEKAERLATLEESKKIALDGITDEETAKTEAYKRLSQQVLLITRQEIIDQIKQLKNLLATVNLPPEVKSNIENQLKGLEVRLKVGADQSNLDDLKKRQADVLKVIAAESKKAKPDLVALNQELAEVNAEIAKLDKNGDGKVSGFQSFLNDLSNSETLKDLANYTGAAADAFDTLGNSLEGVDEGAADTLKTMGTLGKAAANIFTGILSGNPVQIIGSVVGAVGSLFSLGAAARASAIKAAKELAEFTYNVYKGDLDYNAVLRERAILLSKSETLSINNLKNQQAALLLAQQQNLADQASVNARLDGDQARNNSLNDQIAKLKKLGAFTKGITDQLTDQLTGGRYIAGEHTEKYGGFLGIGKKTKVVQDFASLAGKSYADIERLYSEGRLEGDTKNLFEQLKKLKEEGEDVEQQLKDVQKALDEAFTGTTAAALTDRFAELFKNGKPSIDDLAAYFTQTMQDAALSTFKTKFLADALSGFYDEFAKDAASGEGIDDAEYKDLKAKFDALSQQAIDQYDALTKITGNGDVLNAGTGTDLKTAFQGMTTQQADLLAGQYGGQRLAQLENNRLVTENGLSLKQIAAQGDVKLEVLNKIEVNTRTFAENSKYLSKLDAISTSLANIEKKPGKDKTLEANGYIGT